MKELVLAFCLQKSYFSPKGSAYQGDRSDVLKIRLKEFLRLAKNNNSIIYMIREIHSKDDKFFTSSATQSIVGSHDIEIPDIFKPYINMIIDTTRYNSFYKTALDSELNKIKPSKVTLVGIGTPTFIMFTAEELRNRGYTVSLVEPLTLAEDDYLQAVGITIMRNYLAVSIEQ